MKLLIFAALVFSMSLSQKVYSDQPAAEPVICVQTRQAAFDLVAAGDLESACTNFETLLTLKGCDEKKEDQLNAALTHMKAAGVNGGAYARAITTSVDALNAIGQAEQAGTVPPNRPDIFAYYIHQTQMFPQLTDLVNAHMARGIQLHMTAKFFHDSDGYLFRGSLFRLYRAAVMTMRLDPASLTVVQAQTIWRDLFTASWAMKQTMRFPPEVAVLITEVMDNACGGNCPDKTKPFSLQQAQRFVKLYQNKVLIQELLLPVTAIIP